MAAVRGSTGSGPEGGGAGWAGTLVAGEITLLVEEEEAEGGAASCDVGASGAVGRGAWAG